MDFFTFHKLRYNLPGNTRFVEESASLKPGDILIIRGPSAIGKTTLLTAHRTLAENLLDNARQD